MVKNNSVSQTVIQSTLFITIRWWINVAPCQFAHHAVQSLVYSNRPYTIRVKFPNPICAFYSASYWRAGSYRKENIYDVSSKIWRPAKKYSSWRVRGNMSYFKVYSLFRELFGKGTTFQTSEAVLTNISETLGIGEKNVKKLIRFGKQ